jgi:hypothetical protein
MWNLGVSGSAGPYLSAEAGPSLPPDDSLGDYREILLGRTSVLPHHSLKQRF